MHIEGTGLRPEEAAPLYMTFKTARSSWAVTGGSSELPVSGGGGAAPGSLKICSKCAARDSGDACTAAYGGAN